MATIYDLLPTFHQIEPNNLKGLQPGFVVSQRNVVKDDSIIKKVNKVRYVENGRLAQISKAGIKAADGTEKVLFVVYNEPILTVGHNVSNYATDIDSKMFALFNSSLAMNGQPILSQLILLMQLKLPLDVLPKSKVLKANTAAIIS